MAGLADALVVRGIDEEFPDTTMGNAVVDHRRWYDLVAGEMALAQRLQSELRETRRLPHREAVPEAPGARPAPLSIEVALASSLCLFGRPGAGGHVNRWPHRHIAIPIVSDN